MTHANAHMYKAVFSKWSIAKCGPLPTTPELVKAEKIFSPGKNNTISCAMQLRAGGMTSCEFEHTGLGAAYNDVGREVKAGHLRRPAKPLTPRSNFAGTRDLKIFKVIFIKAKKVAGVKAATKGKGKGKAPVKGKGKGKVTTAPSKAANAA